MSGIARQGDAITGTTNGEHAGHYDEWGSPIHGSSTISGTITSGSPNVFINGKAVARAGDSTIESDACDSGQSGSLRSINRGVFVNGLPVALNGDAINPHNGTAHIVAGSGNVSVN
ncbi:MAG: motif [Bacillales bacterium]|jgi:uncharacterized Zn-binding protein involved in type VI secretion|nr:motif [Bacillales bacterium]